MRLRTCSDNVLQNLDSTLPLGSSNTHGSSALTFNICWWVQAYTYEQLAHNLISLSKELNKLSLQITVHKLSNSTLILGNVPLSV